MVVGIPEVTQSSIRTALSTLGPGRPVILVVASNDYSELFDNWLCHMDVLGIERILVIAMDEALGARLAASRWPVARGFFDGSAGDFWLQRARIWAFLADEGVEFIHSDVDAVWLRNPIPEFAAVACDLMFSQGTIHPTDVASQWRFVLCTGFFWARASPPARALLGSLARSVTEILASDDQASLNRHLMAAGTSWATDAVSSYMMDHQGHTFMAFREAVTGMCQSLELKLVLLPHHLFPRLQPGAENAMVRHVLRTGDKTARIDLMRAAGCWRLDAHPRGFAIMPGLQSP
jgi:hypothetical protein